MCDDAPKSKDRDVVTHRLLRSLWRTGCDEYGDTPLNGAVSVIPAGQNGCVNEKLTMLRLAEKVPDEAAH